MTPNSRYFYVIFKIFSCPRNYHLLSSRNLLKFEKQVLNREERKAASGKRADRFPREKYLPRSSLSLSSSSCFKLPRRVRLSLYLYISLRPSLPLSLSVPLSLSLSLLQASTPISNLLEVTEFARRGRHHRDGEAISLAAHPRVVWLPLRCPPRWRGGNRPTV